MADNIIKGHTLGEYYKRYGSLLKKGRLLVLDSKNPSDMELLSNKRRYWEIKTGGRTKYYEAPNRFITALRTPAYSLKRAKPVTKALFAILCVGVVAAVVVPTTLYYYNNNHILRLGDKIIAPDSTGLIEVDNTTVVIGEDYHAVVTVKLERAEISTLSIYVGDSYLTYDVDYLYNEIAEQNGEYKKYDLVVYKEAITGPIEISVEITGLALSRSAALDIATNKYVLAEPPLTAPSQTTYYYDFGNGNEKQDKITLDVTRMLVGRGYPTYNDLEKIYSTSGRKLEEKTLKSKDFQEQYKMTLEDFWARDLIGNYGSDFTLLLFGPNKDVVKTNFNNTFPSDAKGTQYTFREMNRNLEVKRTVDLSMYNKFLTGKIVDIIRYNDDGVVDSVYTTFVNAYDNSRSTPAKITLEISFANFDYKK